jgi:hypothetical protein
MSRRCDYCGDERGENECFARVSHGFGHSNKESKAFCSVECRTWWRRRCSDEPGAWEQPAPKGYQGRLSRFITGESDSESATRSIACSATEAANGRPEASA